MAEQKQFTNVEITAAIKKAVADRGADYVYPESEKVRGGCMYATAEGKPSCIVGYVLNELDKEVFSEVAKWERAKGTVDTAVEDANARIGLGLQRDQVQALRLAQQYQDRGGSWGAAAEKYADVLGEVL